MTRAAEEDQAGRRILHASAVAIDGRGVLIQGRSGAGKSGLALQLMALGAVLISDDRTIVRPVGQAVLASAPDPIRGLIEARGIGLLRAPALPEAPLRLVVSLDEATTGRLPEARVTEICGRPLGLICARDVPNLPAALLQLVRGGRAAP